MFNGFVASVMARALVLSVIFALGFVLEQVIPAERESGLGSRYLNLLTGFFFVVSDGAAAVLVASLFVRFSWNGLSSMLSVPDGGSAAKAFLLLFSWVVMRDFFYYWWHRMQHGSKWLWAEHALHHSDEHINITTGARHHWLEMPLNAIFVVAPLSYLIRPPVITVWAVSFVISMVGFLIHLNVRIGFGRFGWLMASPQNHRIHHSRLSEHIDKNFAQFFPLWDVLFGTYYKAHRDEYPPTGLSSGERVTTLFGSLSMPFVAWRRMIFGRKAE